MPYKELNERIFNQRTELQKGKRELLTKTAEDILYLFDLEPFTNRVLDLEDVLSDFYDRMIEKEKEIKEQRRNLLAS